MTIKGRCDGQWQARRSFYSNDKSTMTRHAQFRGQRRTNENVVDYEPINNTGVVFNYRFAVRDIIWKTDAPFNTGKAKFCGLNSCMEQSTGYISKKWTEEIAL